MMKDMQFWATRNNNAERFQFPVPPEEVRIDMGYSWETIPIAKLGEFTIPSGRILNATTISSHFPKKYDPRTCQYKNIPNPEVAVKMFEKWKDSGLPIRYIITGTFVNYAMSIEKFSPYLRPGALGDWYFDLELREYRFITMKKITMGQTNVNGKAVVTSTKERPNTKELPKTYTVKSGDTLSEIVQKLKTQGVKDLTTDKLYEKNKNIIGKDRNNLKANIKLVIP